MDWLTRRGALKHRVAALAGLGVLALGAAAPANAATDATQFSVTAGTLSFSTAPNAPDLPGLTLNGQAQTLNATMGNSTIVDATGSASGWNVTVNGDSGLGKSAVFKQYCTQALCGTDPLGYVTGGSTLAANSLTLDSTGASFAAQGGTTGTAPTHQCASTCNVDSAGAVKVVSAAANAGMGTYATSTYSGTSLALAAPTTVKALPANEVYRVDLLWTLGSGP
jgi:putative surface cell wall-binding protein